MGFFTKIFGNPIERFWKEMKKTIEQINALEKDLEKLSLLQLKEKTLQLKEKLSQGKTLDDILPESFALVREASKRTLQQRHFDVQLLGGIVLHQGKIAEMKTGEGKTLTATLAVYLNALTGKGVHVVTVNDYLAKRDVIWMGQIYNALGLNVGCVTSAGSFLYEEQKEQQPDLLSEHKSQEKSHQTPSDTERDTKGSFRLEKSFLKPCSKKEAYGADITYGTNNEFGFDYLRDNLVFDIKEKVQRGFYYAIVDEIDSILIDEARTPLIISQPDFESSKLYRDFARLVKQLQVDEHYTMEEKTKTVALTDRGIDKVEKMLGVDNIYAAKGIQYLHFLEQSLKALVFFQKDRDYIVKNNEVIIIDEFTGRLLPGRRYSGGLHQAIEAKEKVPVQPESKILATITFQNYFRFYEKLAGMTGTALSSAEEFDKVYNLTVVPVPTNKPMIRKDLPDKIYKTERAKFNAVVEEIKQHHQRGQPILVGTRSVEKNEYLSKLLNIAGIKHEILNAKNHEREGEIIAQSGRKGAVTVATNMAGRGVDIILGGNPPDPAQSQEVKELGGLYVIGTERHEARRIDDQLRGRAGRQGDPGVSQFFVSLQDDLMRIFGGERIKSLMDTLKIDENQPIQSKIISKTIEKAQCRVEGFNFDARKHILDYDNVIAKHRDAVYARRNEILAKDYSFLKQTALHIVQKEIQNIVRAQQNEPSAFSVLLREMQTIFPLDHQAILQAEKLKSHQEQLLDFLFQTMEEIYAKKENAEGRENMEKILRFVMLKTIDEFWSEHLVALEHLKDSVGLRAYGGRDPLVEYKAESHRLFHELLQDIDRQIARVIFKISFSAFKTP